LWNTLSVSGWPLKPQLSRAFEIDSYFFLLSRVSVGSTSQYFCTSIFSMMQIKYNKMNAYLFLFLCHHGEYSIGFLHATKLFTWGFKIYDAVQQINIFIFFSNAMLMQKSKYAKVKNNSCNAKNKYG
jgi:hypothetical protein